MLSRLGDLRENAPPASLVSRDNAVALSASFRTWLYMASRFGQFPSTLTSTESIALSSFSISGCRTGSKAMMCTPETNTRNDGMQSVVAPEITTSCGVDNSAAGFSATQAAQASIATTFRIILLPRGLLSSMWIGLLAQAAAFTRRGFGFRRGAFFRA